MVFRPRKLPIFTGVGLGKPDAAFETKAAAAFG
jgi:hypothetical protein